jgi:phosphodiesterase/alkaline phosphatase D-like protein
VDSLAARPTRTFRTLDEEGVSQELTPVVVTGMNRFAIRALAMKTLAWEDLRLGFAALEAIVSQQPDFFVGTGDSVDYDSPFIRRAHMLKSMRAKWQSQFTYRTHGLNDLVQIWLTGVRDHRDANTSPLGPEKSIWGEDQREWLKRRAVRTWLASVGALRVGAASGGVGRFVRTCPSGTLHVGRGPCRSAWQHT